MNGAALLSSLFVCAALFAEFWWVRTIHEIPLLVLSLIPFLVGMVINLLLRWELKVSFMGGVLYFLVSLAALVHDVWTATTPLLGETLFLILGVAVGNTIITAFLCVGALTGSWVRTLRI